MKRIQSYITTYLPAAARDSINAQSVVPASNHKPVNKNIRFLPDSIVSELMSGSTVSVRNTNEYADPKPLVPPMQASENNKGYPQPWGSTTIGKVKRSKPRLGGGWGCCLDCAAGENRDLYPWEGSETAVLLLRELIGTLPQNFGSEAKLRELFHSHLQVSFISDSYHAT